MPFPIYPNFNCRHGKEISFLASLCFLNILSRENTIKSWSDKLFYLVWCYFMFQGPFLLGILYRKGKNSCRRKFWSTSWWKCLCLLGHSLHLLVLQQLSLNVSCGILTVMCRSTRIPKLRLHFKLRSLTRRASVLPIPPIPPGWSARSCCHRSVQIVGRKPGVL